jgi:hypothetical protein
MTAPQLLAAIEARGATARLGSGADGMPELVIKPASKIGDLLPDLQRFKPALIKLLATPKAKTLFDEVEESTARTRESPAPSQKPLRRANRWLFVPSCPTPSPGAAKICAVLQGFPTLFMAAQLQQLPTGPLVFDSPRGDRWEIDKPALAVIEIQGLWTYRARECNRAGRGLTTAEGTALAMATALLDGMAVRWDGKKWRDLPLSQSGRNGVTQ